MRAFYGILVVAAMTACKANESVSAVTPPPPDPQPNLWIQLNISGDAQAAPDSFPTTYDGVPWRKIVAGDNRVVAVPGVHTFALASPVANRGHARQNHRTAVVALRSTYEHRVD